MPHSHNGGLEHHVKQITNVVIACLVSEDRHRKRVAKITAIERQYLS